MFEFNREIVNRGGFSFIGVLNSKGLYEYNTNNEAEIQVLEENGFKQVKTNTNKEGKSQIKK